LSSSSPLRDDGPTAPFGSLSHSPDSVVPPKFLRQGPPNGALSFLSPGGQEPPFPSPFSALGSSRRSVFLPPHVRFLGLLFPFPLRADRSPQVLFGTSFPLNGIDSSPHPRRSTLGDLSLSSGRTPRSFGPYGTASSFFPLVARISTPGLLFLWLSSILCTFYNQGKQLTFLHGFLFGSMDDATFFSPRTPLLLGTSSLPPFQ